MTENIDRTNSGLFGVKLQQSPKIPASRLSFPGFHSPFSCVMSCSAVSVWGKLTSATNLDNLSTKIWCSEPAMACCCCCSSYSTSRSKDNTTLPQQHYSNVFCFFFGIKHHMHSKISTGYSQQHLMHILNNEVRGSHYEWAPFVWKMDHVWDFKALGCSSFTMVCQTNGIKMCVSVCL